MLIKTETLFSRSLYISFTGWPSRLCKTSRWPQNKSFALALTELMFWSQLEVLHKLLGHPGHNHNNFYDKINPTSWMRMPKIWHSVQILICLDSVSYSLSAIHAKGLDDPRSIFRRVIAIRQLSSRPSVVQSRQFIGRLKSQKHRQHPLSSELSFIEKVPLLIGAQSFKTSGHAFLEFFWFFSE